VDGSQVSVFKEGNEVSFAGLLESENGRGLEAKVSLEVLSNFTDEPLEGELPDQELSRFLITSNFTKGDSSRPEPVRLLDTTCGGGSRLPSGLSGELFTRGLATS